VDRYKFLFLKVFFLLLLTSCVNTPQMPESVETFVLRGKVAVREGEENFTANLLWQQQANGFEMELWGPLGQGRVKIVKKGADIELRNGAGSVLAQGDVQSVMREQLGWSLPIDILPAWVQGHPLADEPVQGLEYDQDGHPSAFEQLGWNVVLDRYESVVAGAESRSLPTRITAERGQARLRLVVSEWRI
jgi:outer membrane lipoprotein LolB